MRAIKAAMLLMTILSFGNKAAGQDTMTSSPYSMFGIGDIISGLRGQNSAMGGVAYGVRSPLFINTENPAGLAGMGSQRLIAEVSVFGKYEAYRSNGNSNDVLTGNLSAFMMGGRILPGWYAAAGVTPYSSVGYYFQSTQEVEGSPGTYMTSIFKGTGGISKASLSNAFLLPGGISAGVNMSYVFGSMTQDETQETMTVSNAMDARAFYADFGLQYHRVTGRHTSFTLGAVYGYRQKLNIKNTMTVTTSVTQTETKLKEADQYLPQFVGFGGSVTHKKMTYALDYTYRQYSALTSGDTRITFNDTHELRGGINYSPQGLHSDGYWRRMAYKAGFTAGTNYMSISRKDGYRWRASGGVEFPVVNGKINAAVFYENMKVNDNRLQSKTVGLTISYTIEERFRKIKLD